MAPRLRGGSNCDSGCRVCVNERLIGCSCPSTLDPCDLLFDSLPFLHFFVFRPSPFVASTLPGFRVRQAVSISPIFLLPRCIPCSTESSLLFPGLSSYLPKLHH